jgi:DNA-binding SARP family transcriptional activator
LRQSDASCSYILFQNDAYLINPELTIWIDYEAFLDHFHNAQRFANCGQIEKSLHEMRSAESLYQGELFEDDPYDEWVAPQRHTLHNHYIEIIDFLSRHAFSEQDYATCIMFCKKQLLVDTCCEDAHRRLMQCYVALAQHYLAMRQYHECVEQLQLNLDVAPSPKTVELYEEIRATI